MGKLISAGSPLKFRFEDDAGTPIDAIEINGTRIKAVDGHWFVTDVDVQGRADLNLFRVTDLGRNQAAIEFRCGN